MADLGMGDLLPVLALVAPGFLVLYLVSTFRGRRFRGHPVFVTLGSILLSGVLALLFLAWNGLRDGAAILAYVLEHPVRTVAQFTLLALAASGAAALLEDHNPLRWSFHALLRRTKGRVVRAESVWDDHLRACLDHPVLVEAHDGRLIGGFLRQHSVEAEDEPAALVLVKPALVRRGEDGELSGVHLGGIFLQASDVRTLTALDGPLVDEAPRP